MITLDVEAEIKSGSDMGKVIYNLLLRGPFEIHFLEKLNV